MTSRRAPTRQRTPRPAHLARGTRLALLLGALLLGAPGEGLAQAAPVAGRAAAALTPAARDSLRATIRRLIDSAGAPSVAVGVARGGEVLWADGFGYADVAGRTPATSATLYSMASISKPLTATAVLRLVQQGRVELDRPIDDYLAPWRLTGLAGDRTQATVRRVLSHTAGLPLHYRFFYEGAPDTPDVALTVERYGRVMFPPGQVYSYSNLGYGLLGELVARRAGASYQEAMRDLVFLPLGMTRTAIGTGAGIANAAVRYDDRGRPIPHYDFDHRGASAVYTSVDELLRFAALHLKVRPPDAPADAAPLLTDSVIDLMQRVATPGSTESGYGLGWSIDDDLGARRVRHTGGMPGVATVLSLYPAHGVAVVVLMNQSSPLAGRIATEVAAAVLPPSYAQALAARRAAPPPPVPAFTAPEELRGEWRGTVRTYDDATVPFTLRIDSGQVRVRLDDRPGLWTLLDNASFRGRLLSGRFLGTIPSADALRVPHVVAMSLHLQDGTLRGWAAAQVFAETNDYSLSSYAELTRADTAATVGNR